MSRLHQHKDSPQEIFVQYVILDVVSMMLHTEGKKFKNEAEELYSTGIHSIRTFTSSIRKKRSCK